MNVDVPRFDDPFLAAFSAGDPIALPEARLEMLKSIASDIFPGEIGVRVEDDSEIENCRYLVFTVIGRGSPQEIVSRRREWYQRTAELVGEDCDKIRLSIEADE